MCGHDECEGFLLCQLVPIPDCSGQWEPPAEDWNETYTIFPVEHGTRCKGHRVYRIWNTEPSCSYSPASGLKVKEEYL
jgi:hypothetical protein